MKPRLPACPACDGSGIIEVPVRYPPALPVSPCELYDEHDCERCEGTGDANEDDAAEIAAEQAEAAGEGDR